ncbi:DUF3397 family protein [Clostridium sp. 1xD42-85]|uniref:DUF3397 family protein n=1 Tax=Clostridium sp. 1xD42-85 TaxID=2320084 RepID=UPI000EA1F5DA|nr:MULTISPECIES: DUF3397 family protein [Clostridia]NBJ68502.1 DUF3397 family protein [Roseburia sp. 1XD42-34]RKI81258.1 DUF3397 family protein [Clostridium sp. 1xD42-85]
MNLHWWKNSLYRRCEAIVKNGIIYLAAFFISIPFMATWLTYVFSYKLTRRQIKSFHLAVYWTTPLYLIAVTLMVEMIIGVWIAGVIMILLLILLIGILFFQWKQQTEVLLFKAIKLTWRISFLAFGLLYGMLIITGILQRIFF